MTNPVSRGVLWCFVKAKLCPPTGHMHFVFRTMCKLERRATQRSLHTYIPFNDIQRHICGLPTTVFFLLLLFQCIQSIDSIRNPAEYSSILLLDTSLNVFDKTLDPLSLRSSRLAFSFFPGFGCASPTESER
ncbi:hypothetical protein TWF696_000184 [Orbilia brochopaga]|uniref:Uncharacterized protein n=1 Tax=Orbilia brochopaga TaxID=3140254 RepID=A0AAV9VC46_9PEZI